MARRWSRDELIALANGRRISARTTSGGELEAPAWLLAHSAGPWLFNSSDTLALLHPDDRGDLVDAFLAAVADPGEPAEVTYRSSADGYWHYSTTTWIDLSEHPDVGCILSFSQPIDGPPVAAPEDIRQDEYNRTRWMVWTLSVTSEIVAAEGACEELTGCEPHELIGQKATVFLADEESIADTIELWVTLHESPGTTATARRRLRQPDGSKLWVDASYLRRLDRTEEESVLLVVWDATQTMAEEQARLDQTAELQRSERRAAALAADFQMLADEVPAAVFRCDPTGAVLFHNARWGELVDGDASSVACVQELVAPDERSGLDALLAEIAGSDTAQRGSLEAVSACGARVWRVNLRGMGEGGENLVGSVEDVTMTVQLRREARFDALTGLRNRAAIEERIEELLATDPARTVVLFVDLDGFKAVNDTYGHDAGDTVLTEVGRRLAAGVRPTDVVGRYGGDEFIIVCEDDDPFGAAVPERLHDALGDTITFAGGSWEPAASIGWTRGEVGDTPASVLRRADLHMFERKRDRHSHRR